jgi:hypothetical protein
VELVEASVERGERVASAPNGRIRPTRLRVIPFMRRLPWLAATFAAALLIALPVFVPRGRLPAYAVASDHLSRVSWHTGLRRTRCAGAAALVSLCWIALPRHGHGSAGHRVPRV